MPACWGSSRSSRTASSTLSFVAALTLWALLLTTLETVAMETRALRATSTIFDMKGVPRISLENVYQNTISLYGPGVKRWKDGRLEGWKAGRLEGCFFRLFHSSTLPLFHPSIMSSNLSEVHTAMHIFTTRPKENVAYADEMIYKGIMKSLALLLFLLILPLSAFASVITADSYLLVEKDSLTVIAGKDYHHPLPPASTTKVMTTILALEKLDEEQSIVPTKKVLSIPASKLSLFPGRPYKAIDLIKGALVESANDAAYSLSVAVAGSEEKFAEMMNAKAREIGALESHFENASGLYVPGHRMSAYDLALIFRYALENKRFQEIIGTKYFFFSRGDTGDVRYMNHNRLLFCFAPSIGGKTGFTRASKQCYVGAFQKEGKTYILSILGSRSLWTDACNILQQIYTEVPTQREISLVKASNIAVSSLAMRDKKITFTSYTVKKHRKPVVKKRLKRLRKRKHLRYRRV